MKKYELLSRLYKLKTQLYDGQHEEQNEEWHDGAHFALSKVLDVLQEYRE